MSTHSGHEGIAKIGANTIAEVTGFTLNESAETVDDTELSDTAKTHIAGQTSWDGSIDCHWDETDTNGQEAMTVGASVTVDLYPEGDVSTDRHASGTATITSITKGNTSGSPVTASFTFTGNGALTWAAVV